MYRKLFGYIIVIKEVKYERVFKYYLRCAIIYLKAGDNMGYIEDLRKIIGHKCINLVGSVVIIKNERDEILLQKRTFPVDTWSFPGGLSELGENTLDTAVREVREETSLEVKNLELFGFYSSDGVCKGETGDEWCVYIAAYVCRDFSGEVKINDGESAALEWTALSNLPERFGKSQKRILDDYVKSQTLTGRKNTDSV